MTDIWDTSPVEAFAQALIPVGRAATTLSVTGNSGPYFIGEKRGFTVRGSAASASDRFESVVNAAACPASPDNAGATFFSGPFEESFTLTTRDVPAMTVCAWIVHDGQVYASAQSGLTQVPLPAPVALARPAAAAHERRPAFSWTAPPERSTDTFRLADQDDVPLLYATAAGGAAMPLDEDEWDDLDPATGVRVDDSGRPRARQPRREKTGNAVWTAPGGVRLARKLPPGRYSWTVTRDRFDGQRSTLGPVTFRVLGPPLRTLRVSKRDVRYRSSRAPGFTRLRIMSTPYVTMRLQLKRAGRTRVVRLRAGARSSSHIDVAWSCNRAGSPYRWTLTARDDQDRTLTRRGVIHPISAAACRALRSAERRERQQRAEARARRQQEAEARRRAAEQRQRERQARNCRRLDGHVERLELPRGGTTEVCLTPYGIYPLDNL